MFWGWWDHTFYVYQLCTWMCMRRDVRRRTTHDVIRRRTQCERPLRQHYSENWTIDYYDYSLMFGFIIIIIIFVVIII